MTGIYGDYNKFNNNSIYTNGKKDVEKKTVEHKSNDPIDVTGAKYRGEVTDLNKTPEGVKGTYYALGLELNSKSPLFKDNDTLNKLIGLSGVNVGKYVSKEEAARITDSVDGFTSKYFEGEEGAIDDFNFLA